LEIGFAYLDDVSVDKEVASVKMESVFVYMKRIRLSSPCPLQRGIKAVSPFRGDKLERTRILSPFGGGRGRIEAHLHTNPLHDSTGSL
jgi:hypothetical protein